MMTIPLILPQKPRRVMASRRIMAPEPGTVFGGWTVLRALEFSKYGWHLLCRCNCGTERVVLFHNIRFGKSASCGCLHKLTHGMSSTDTWHTWDSMKQRVLNPKNSRWSSYGGRGITICERWLRFENFVADMGLKPSPGHSLDRINNDLGYWKANCRWATRKEQQRNRRITWLVEYKGESLSVAEWAERRAMKYCVLSARLNRGWTVDDALNRPVEHKR